MKRLLLLLLLGSSLPLAAQDMPRSVKEIRQLYAEVQQGIASMSDEPHSCRQLVSTFQYNVPGTGIRKETQTVYFSEYGDSDGWTEEGDWKPDYRPFFLTRKYNIAVHRFYEEYLYDRDSGRLVFVFLQGDSWEDAQGKDETRYYFGPEGLISESIKGERLESVENILKKAGTLYEAARTSFAASVSWL
ncbi:MAG: hypothetical protein IJ636_06545 [Bacteroidales bacterium]|nr:hypothetical protein [Bacteroidales bacterium]